MKLKPKKLTEEQMKKVAEVTASQTGGQVFKKTTDGTEVFTVPINSKVLVYVPNHNDIVDGIPQLRMDKPFLHSVKDNGYTRTVRCTAGAEELGYSSCPLCENVQFHWDLARKKIEEACKVQGLDPDDKNSDAVKAIRSKFYGARTLDSTRRQYTFPIVVIDQNTKTEDGMPELHPMWYSISEKFYKRTWGKTLKAIVGAEEEVDLVNVGEEDDDGSVIPSPGGMFFVLDFTYDTAGKQPDRMQSALNLSVISKKVPAKYADLIKKMDDMTKDWTPERAATTVVSNIFYDEEDMKLLADELTDPVKQLIELYDRKTEVATNALEAPKNVAVGALEGGQPLEVIETDVNDLEDLL